MQNETLIGLINQFDDWLADAIEATENNSVATQELMDEVKASLTFQVAR